MSEIQVHRADWVLPITAAPVHDGAVAIHDHRIVDVGPALPVEHAHPDALVVEHGEAVLVPGLVNAHTHLSLSALAGFDAGAGLMDWLGRLSRTARQMTADEVRTSVKRGVDESWALGTVLLGEITTRSEGLRVLFDHDGMMARIFFEFLGVRESRARESFEAARANVRAMLEDPYLSGVLPGLSPHAPYSVWPALWKEMTAFARSYRIPWSTHFAEPPGEREFMIRGTGPLKDFLESMGFWDGSFRVPETSSLDFLEANEALNARCLLVHGLHVGGEEMQRIEAAGASLCLCPRSNAYLGLPAPQVRQLVSAGINLCLGTDSLASNRDLSVWAEMRAIRELAPTLPSRTILEMATVNGAGALGMGHLAGSLRPGFPARVLAVDTPGLGTGDPHDFLVNERVETVVRHLES